MKYITGIGSRETPYEIIKMMHGIGADLCHSSKGFTLRSGGADGADTAFEFGADAVVGEVEIFLPWKGFNKDSEQRKDLPVSDLYLAAMPKDRVLKAKEIAARHHPVWNRLTHGAQLLHTRNVFQVLGRNLDSPSNVLICWTKGGGVKGGTATAMKIAKEHGVQIFNLYSPIDITLYNEWKASL